MIKVSVVIPYYNHLKYFNECIESVLAQTYKNLEIIVVNDGSPDNFDEVIQPYLIHNNVKYIKQTNGGVSSARNTGIRCASGTLILPFDCDDIMEPDWVEEAVKLMTDTLVLVSTYYPYYNENMEYTGYTWPTGHPIDITKDNTVGSSSMFFKKTWEEVGQYDEELQFMEDWDLWIRMIQHGCYVKVLHKPMIKYRRHSDNYYELFIQNDEHYKRVKEKHNIL